MNKKQQKISDDALIVYDVLLDLNDYYKTRCFSVKNDELEIITGIRSSKMSKIFGELKENNYIRCEYEFDKTRNIKVRRIFIV